MRQAAQCVGRIIRSKTDYGIVVLADKRFNKPDKRAKLPPWIRSFIRTSSLNLSTDFAVEQIKVFLKVMGQPIDRESLTSILLSEEDVNKKSDNSSVSGYGDSLTFGANGDIGSSIGSESVNISGMEV